MSGLLMVHLTNPVRLDRTDLSLTGAKLGFLSFSSCLTVMNLCFMQLTYTQFTSFHFHHNWPVTHLIQFPDVTSQLAGDTPHTV